MHKNTLPSIDEALPGRDQPIVGHLMHAIFNRSLTMDYPANAKIVDLGMGCFWGAERLFWQQPGVVMTLVGYAGGITPNPTYQEVCSGLTGHAECVRVIFDPEKTTLQTLLECFFTHHDPTQGMRQGNDVGTQYRSIVLVHNEEDQSIAEQVLQKAAVAYQAQGYAALTTTVQRAMPFYLAEEMHQQYLYKNPQGYCGLKSMSVEI